MSSHVFPFWGWVISLEEKISVCVISFLGIYRHTYLQLTFLPLGASQWTTTNEKVGYRQFSYLMKVSYFSNASVKFFNIRLK